MNTPTRQEKIARALLNPRGISEREAVVSLNMTSGRNEVNEIEHLLNVKFCRQWEKTVDGHGQYYRYSVADKTQAHKLIQFINGKATARHVAAFTTDETRAILAQFNDKED